MNWFKRTFRLLPLREAIEADIADAQRHLYLAKRRAALEAWHVKYYTQQIKDLQKELSHGQR